MNPGSLSGGKTSAARMLGRLSPTSSQGTEPGIRFETILDKPVRAEQYCPWKTELMLDFQRALRDHPMVVPYFFIHEKQQGGSTMRKLSVLLISLMLTSTSGCEADDNSGFDRQAYCSDICNVEFDCQVGWDTYEQCYSNCSDRGAPSVYEAFLNTFHDCYMEATCEDIQNSADGCVEEAFVHCVSDATAAHTAYCAKMLECEYGEAPTQQEVDACLDQLTWETAYLPCAKPAPLASFARCMENGTCSETLYDDCYESTLN
jgi:hypothetical protein